MSAKDSRRLVIDACVAAAAGTTDHPVSSACRAVLITALKVCHRVVMTEAIREEWKDHQSQFSARWLSSMVARRKLVVIEPAACHEARSTIPEMLHARELERDLHLVEAALSTDCRILSLDEAARAGFRQLAVAALPIRSLIWANPCIPSEHVLNWLRDGARAEPHRQLHPA